MVTVRKKFQPVYFGQAGITPNQSDIRYFEMNLNETTDQSIIRLRNVVSPVLYTVDNLPGVAVSSTNTTTVTLTSGSVDSDGFLIYSDQGWTTSNLKYIENSTMKVGFAPEGGIVAYVALKSDNINRINDYIVTDPKDGQQKRDVGRQGMEFSDYCSPWSNYAINGKNTGTGYTYNAQPYVFDTGANMVQGGSLFPALDPSLVLKSAIVQTSDRGSVFCLQVRPRIWGVQGENGHLVGDYEGWLSDNALIYKARHIIENRPVNAAQPDKFQSHEQENPCLYVLANYTTHLTKVGGVEVNRFPTQWQQPGKQFSNSVYSDECWIGAYPSSNGSGVTYYSPYNSTVKSGQFGGLTGTSFDNNSSYLNGALSMNYDSPGTYISPYTAIILGTKTEALAKISTLLPIDQSFDFNFNSDNHRWNNIDCRAKRENGSWKVYIGDVNQDNSTNGTFISPARAWQASQITSIEFTMSAVSGATKLWFYWHKPGEQNDDTKRFRKAINVSNGTFIISTSDANWNGTISWIGLGAIRNGDNEGNPVTSNGAYIIPTRIRKV